MKRRTFISNSLAFSVIASMNPLKTFGKVVEDNFQNTPRMPVLFVGHGSPYNALQDNEFTQKWKSMARSIPKPNAIICVSAHWLTRGSWITAMEKPKTIHDFAGFSEDLFSVQYPAPGSPELALETKNLFKEKEIGLDQEWGLDHGSWSVIKQMYPDADIPVLQLSIDYHQSPEHHYKLAKDLSSLRNKGVLIIGSGNMVHNLRRVEIPKGYDPMSEGMEIAYGFDWAQESNEIFKDKIQKEDHQALIDYKKLGKAVQQSIPTPDHYYPLLYSLGLKEKGEEITLFNDKCVAGSISMTSVLIS